MSDRLFSLGICSNNPAKTNESVFHWRRALTDIQPEVEVLAIDAKSMANGYNQIIDACKTKYLILSHNDAWPFPISTYHCGKRLAERMETVKLLGFAGAGRCTGPRWFDDISAAVGSVINFPATPPGQQLPPEQLKVFAEGMRPCLCSSWGRPAKLVRNIRTMDGYCMIVDLEVARQIRFDERFSHFHQYDQDFAMAVHAAGYATAVCCDVYISHNSQGSYSQAQWIESIEPFLAKWAGKMDGPITGVGKSAIAYQSGDARLVLLALQRDEIWMKDEVSF